MNAITKGYQDVPMTRRRAQLLEEYASKLADMLEAAPNDKDLAEWVQSKIDRAAAAIQSAYHYLDQDDESDLEKAVGHKYTHRKLVGRDPKTNRARYRYYYAEHQGGGISRAKFEAGSAFKLTWKGRRGHFHIDRVEGDQVFITHDSRPDMEPVPVQADELRALLTKQHSKAERKHVEKRRREVEEIKRRAHRGGLGLALHRLRQAADQAGVTLPEQYQRKPKKTRAKVAETAREVESASSIKERWDRLQEKTDTLEAEIESLEDAIENPPPFIPSDDAGAGFYEWQEGKRRRESKLKAEIETLKAQHSAQEEELRALSLHHHNAQQRERAERRAQRAPAETPRDQLTSTAQQIIEDANQEHGERHEEHQEITRFELGEHTHTKTGQKLYTAKQTERVERDEYFRRVAIAKKHGGRYERRYVRGFVFKSAEDARAFALEVSGAAQEAPETSAETVTPHDEHPGADNFETMPEVESAGSPDPKRQRLERLKRMYTPSKKKEITPDKYVISFAHRSGGKDHYLISIGDPRKQGSKTVGLVQYKEGVQDWLSDNKNVNISENHIIDVSGLNLVSDEHTDDFMEMQAKIKEDIDSLQAELDRSGDTQPTTPARQALTETAERVTSDQTAEEATTREETLKRYGYDLSLTGDIEVVRKRARFVGRGGTEAKTRTGQRSRAQKLRDRELLLMYRRLQSDAQERLGATAPRFADYSQLIDMPRTDQPENAETRVQIRTALQDAIRELIQATSGRAESVQGLDAYRALEGTFIGHLEEHLKTVSDQDLRAMRGAIDAEVARVEKLTKDEKKRRDDTSAALDKIAEERAAVTRKIEALKPRRDKALDRKESRLNRAYGDQWSEARRAHIAYIEKRRENKDPLVDKLSKPLKREENRRARRVQKSARPLITYRAQLIQTVERLTA